MSGSGSRCRLLPDADPWNLQPKTCTKGCRIFRRRLWRACLLRGLCGRLFLAGFLEGAGKHFLFGGAGNDADAVEIAEDNVAGCDARLADLNGNTEVNDLAARALVLRITAVREGAARLRGGFARRVLHVATGRAAARRRAVKGLRAVILARALCVSVPLIVFARVAEAHVHQGEEVSFLSGLRHPISGLDHIVAMLAVGLWGAQLGAPAIWMLPVTFPLVMALGGMLGLLGVPLPGTELGIAASAILLGGAVMLRARPPSWVAAILVGFFAIFHGMRTVASCRRGRTACCTAWGS